MASRSVRYQVGQMVKVTIDALFPFGAFVRLDAQTRGYIRRRELLFEANIDPRVRFRIGQVITAKVVEPAAAGRHIELSHVLTLTDPWLAHSEMLAVGRAVRATVIRLHPQGVYVEIVPGVQGFIPLGELSGRDVARPEQAVWEDDRVEAEIVRVDVDNRLVHLSVRAHLLRRVKARRIAAYLQTQREQEEEAHAHESTAGLGLQPLPPPQIGQGERILIVEDGETLRRQLATWLEHRGFSVAAADSIEVARAHVAAEAYHAAFVDMDLAGNDGLEFVKEARRVAPTTQVIVMSIPELIEARLVEINGHRVRHILIKPLDLDEIEQLLTHIMRDESAAVPEEFSAEDEASAPTTVFQDAHARPRHDMPLAERLRAELDMLVDMTTADVGMIFHLNPITGAIEVIADTLGRDWDPETLYPLRDSPVHDVLRLRRSVLENHVSAERADEYRNLLHFLDFEAVIGVPIETQGEVRYTLFLFHHLPDVFNRFRLRDAWATGVLCAAHIERDQTQRQLTAIAGLLLSGELAAGLSHEIFNKLSGLELSMVNLQAECSALSQEAAPVTASPRYGRLHDNMTKLIATGRDLRNTVALFQKLMRARSGAEIDVNQTLNNVLRLASTLAKSHRVQLVAAFEQDLPAACGSEIRLQQACLNVIINGIQQIGAHSAAGGSIRIESRLDAAEGQPSIQIRIIDSGPGIHHSLWEKVFDLGFTSRDEGSGLGLYIARSLLAADDGQIAVADSLMGLGSTFLITLPVLTREPVP